MSKHQKYFVLLFFVTLVGVSCQLEQDTGHTEYAILLDAGSSGTKPKIYQFLSSGPSLKPSDVLQLDASPRKVKPGLSTFGDDPSQIEANMILLIESAKKVVPEDKQASTPIYLLATAGMRLLPEDQANAILTEVRKLLKDKSKCPFLFENDNDARIITGQAEGTYLWRTVNFLKGVFRAKNPVKSYGSLDLGGASHQNAWQFNKNRSDNVEVHVAGRKFNLFVRSYLSYGLEEAQQRYLRFIAQKSHCGNSPECVVQSPCHNKGFKESIIMDDQEHTFEGTSDTRLCRLMIRDMFFCQLPDSQKCPFHDQPKLKGKFYAVAGLYYTLRDIGAVCADCDDNKVTPRMVREYYQLFCKKDFDELPENPYAKKQCFGAIYIYELLKVGYHLKPSKKIMVAGSLHGFDLSWSLGAVLDNTGILDE